MSESIPAHSPELITQLEKDVGVPEGFFATIIHEDDWSLVIKLHGLIEAGLTQILAAYFDDPRLESLFARMGLGGQFGKLAFIRALELLPGYNISFIQKVADIRNSVVHRIDNVSFSIEAHLRSLDHATLLKFVEACGDGVIPEGDDWSRPPYEERQVEQLLKDPRKSFWWSSVYVLGNISKSKMFHKASRRIEEIERQAGRVILKKGDPKV